MKFRKHNKFDSDVTIRPRVCPVEGCEYVLSESRMGQVSHVKQAHKMSGIDASRLLGCIIDHSVDKRTRRCI